MTEQTLAALDLTDKTPAELEQRRRDLVTRMTTEYKGYDDPDIPRSLLQELAIITSTLRRRNAGPPKKAKEPNGKAKKAGLDDVLNMI